MDNYKLEISDLQGRLATEEQFNVLKTTVDLSAISNGIYFYQVVSRTKTLALGKVFVNHEELECQQKRLMQLI